MLSKFAVAGKATKKESACMDEIIRRRLQNDGDGVGDERRISNVLKGIQDFVSGDFSSDEADSRMAHLIGQLKQIEYGAKRTTAAIKSAKETSLVYDGVKKEIQSETVKTKEAIKDAKFIIEEETKNRKHSMEYEALTRLIDSKPDRKLTAEKRRQLQQEVKGLDSLKEDLARKVASREQQLQSLSMAIQLIKDQVDQTVDYKVPTLAPAASTAASEGSADEAMPGPSTPPLVDPAPGGVPSPSLADILSLISTRRSVEDKEKEKSTPEHEFSQPAEPGTSTSVNSTTSASATVKEKYEDLSEESPEEGESED